MAIERNCINCALEQRCPKNVRDDWDEVCRSSKLFVPNEELVRQDERNKILGQVIGLLKSDLESWDFSTTKEQ